LNLKREGYFVEFGATDGKSLSNTYILEKEFGWNGICVEPAVNWRQDLAKNRKCNIDFRCVYSSSGNRIAFKQTRVPELSTIADLTDKDFHSLSRKSGRYYDVTTITLVDLLDEYNAPTEIDYISIDTEGSELEILKEFDFIKYKVRVFTIEHNFTPNRDMILELMESKGYERVLQDISDFDDWYLLT
jgi:FkbM family methyltransferase